MSWGAPATSTAKRDVERRIRAVDAVLEPLEGHLWALAVIVAAGDVVLTAWGLQAGLAEGNPVVAALLSQVGIVALVGLKGALLGLAAGCRWLRPRWGPWLPLGLALPWAVAVAINGTLLLA